MSLTDFGPLTGEPGLRDAIEQIADQICSTVDGAFDLHIHVDTDDDTVAKLQMLVNFLVDSARRALSDVEEQREALERQMVELEQVDQLLVKRAEELEEHKTRLEREIARRVAVEDQLRHDAHHDALTALPNRTLLRARLDHCSARARTLPDHNYGVLFIDLDNFKVINDSLGHDTGDELLVETADRLVACLQELETVSRLGKSSTGRLGGDEFIVVLDGVASAGDAITVAERIQRAMTRAFQIGGQEIGVSASIGIAMADPASEEAQDLLRDADTAMYRAKSAGKAQHAVFNRAMHEMVTARLTLESDLRKAFDEDQFEVHYQPIVALTSARICAFESLIRWNHEQRGYISPADFIPIAEDIGLIVPLGEWVLEQACLQLKRWHEQRPANQAIAMSVNVSRKQLQQPEFVDGVHRILRETGVEGRFLKLEVTESVIMADPESVVEVLEQLRDAGIEISMDDFGTGYSSLSLLHRLPLNTLKIDRSFIATMGINREYAAIVNAIVTLAQNLGMSVVAEGIETKEQLAQMLAFDCDYGQGYFFSKALPAEDAGALIDDDQEIMLRKSA